MATVFCPACGQPSPIGTTQCPRCGSAIPGLAAAPSAPFAGTPAAVPSAWSPFAPPPTVSTKAAERSAARLLRIAFVINLIGVLLANVVPQVVSALTGGSGFSLVGPFGARSASLTSLFYVIGAITAVGFFIGAASWWLGHRAFVDLKPADSNFNTPAALTLVGLVGLVLLGLGYLVFLGELGSLVQCVGTGSGNLTPTPNCFTGQLGALLGALALLGIGLILALIGVIGYILGLWRVGTRYQETLIQVGAILTIFPVLNFIGYILLLVGISNAQAKIEARSF